MAGFDPIVNIALILAAALVGGMVAHRLRQPVILGYLLVGVALGPHGFGLVSDLELIETLATIGVALLMFTVGLEISYSQLWAVGRIGIWGGVAQISATFALGMVAGWLIFDWALSDAAFFGLIISLSSTMVGLKLLMERGVQPTTCYAYASLQIWPVTVRIGLVLSLGTDFFLSGMYAGKKLRELKN